jgi:hypothetical protein
VTFFCFIESALSDVPHMEPLSAEDPAGAAAEARRLLSRHASGRVAHVYLGDNLVVTVRQDEDREPRQTSKRPDRREA